MQYHSAMAERRAETVQRIDKEVLKTIAREAIARGGDSKETALVIGISTAYRLGYQQAYRDLTERETAGEESRAND